MSRQTLVLLAEWLNQSHRPQWLVSARGMHVYPLVSGMVRTKCGSCVEEDQEEEEIDNYYKLKIEPY